MSRITRKNCRNGLMIAKSTENKINGRKKNTIKAKSRKAFLFNNIPLESHNNVV